MNVQVIPFASHGAPRIFGIAAHLRASSGLQMGVPAGRTSDEDFHQELVQALRIPLADVGMESTLEMTKACAPRIYREAR